MAPLRAPADEGGRAGADPGALRGALSFRRHPVPLERQVGLPSELLLSAVINFFSTSLQYFFRLIIFMLSNVGIFIFYVQRWYSFFILHNVPTLVSVNFGFDALAVM